MLLFSNIKHIIPASICRPPYSLKHKKQAHIPTDTTKIQIKFEKRAPFSIFSKIPPPISQICNATSSTIISSLYPNEYNARAFSYIAVLRPWR